MSKIKIELELSIDDSLELIKFLKKKNIGRVDVCDNGCYGTISGLGGIVLTSGSGVLSGRASTTNITPQSVSGEGNSSGNA